MYPSRPLHLSYKQYCLSPSVTFTVSPTRISSSFSGSFYGL
nr:MAG TPA: hypothetical protein [Caudoviricetes sp.]